jgi:Cupin superfamily protein
MSERLGELIAPVRLGDFMSRYWQREGLFCAGAAERFAELLPWSDLNAVLERHWREAYRFRIACRGRDVDPASYADVNGSTPRIRARDVTGHLARGATLSFHGIDEVHPPITRLAHSFEAWFDASTQVNAYCGFRSLHGLDLHRDGQEVFILQIQGRKRWLLYGFSIDGVEWDALEPRSEPPSGSTFDRVLSPGDVLYIPRGCYHVALPLNEPTLHLTIAVRTDKPVTARPSFGLPWSAAPEGLPAGGEFHVALNARSGVAVNGPDGGPSIEVQCNGRAFRFPPAVRLIIDELNGGAPRPIGDLVAALAGRLDEPIVRLLVGLLARQDLVRIREQGCRPSASHEG